MKEIKLKVNDIDVKIELLVEGKNDDHALVKAIPPQGDKCTYYVKKSVQDGKNQIYLAIYLKKSASKDMDFHRMSTTLAEKVVNSLWESEAQKESAERELQVTIISDKIESELFEDFIITQCLEKVQ